MSESYYKLLMRIEDLKGDLQTELDRALKNHTRFAGRVTTVGGAALEVVPVQGAKTTMHCIVILYEVGATPVTIVKAQCGDGVINVTFSADPSSDHQITYLVC